MNLRRTLALALGFLTVWHVPSLLPGADVAVCKAAVATFRRSVQSAL